MAQKTDIVYLENNEEYIRRDIKMFIPYDSVIYSYETIQQKNQVLSMMTFCARQYYYLKRVNI